jgi:hypothetical protein
MPEPKGPTASAPTSAQGNPRKIDVVVFAPFRLYSRLFEDVSRRDSSGERGLIVS